MAASLFALFAFPSSARAKPTTAFEPEITTKYPFDSPASSAVSRSVGKKSENVGGKTPAGKPPSKPGTSGSKRTPNAVPAQGASTATPLQGAVGASGDDRPVIEDPWLRLRGSEPEAAAPSPKVPSTQAPQVSLVRVPWADVPMTLAAAQRDLAWRATLPSSGIAAWGMNPVQNPERSLVEVLVGGGVVGVGVVLEGGAVLTSLSVIGRGLEVQVRFSDGTVEAASVRRTHRAYDLALLEARTARVRTGLPLARQVNDSLGLLFWGHGVRTAPSSSTKTSAAKPTANRGMVRPVPLQWYGASWGADGVPIHAALRPPQLTELGTPLVNASGHLAALVTLACVVDEPRSSLDATGCRVTRVGLTSGTLGEFLGMVEQDSARVWFGVIGETTDTGWARGVRVKGLTSGSPAAAAGLRPASDAKGGDVIVAIDNIPVYEMDQLRSALRSQRPGAKPVLTVLRDGRLRQIVVTLPSTERPLPVAETPEPWVSF